MAGPAADGLSTACALEMMRVQTRDGRFLGHVFDLRCDWQPGQRNPPLIGEIIFGRRGLLERVGLRHVRPDSLPWSAVESVQGGVIVVAGKGKAKR
ncbi:MAG TPA: hypothetical protein VF169_20360 [Albitalea sp.]|uniref:PRC-barrel domain-containing protein n=1 Tax=Piscinibacter sp. TaxID=1903157 RepID=UPI002ED63505